MGNLFGTVTETDLDSSSGAAVELRNKHTPQQTHHQLTLVPGDGASGNVPVSFRPKGAPAGYSETLLEADETTPRVIDLSAGNHRIRCHHRRRHSGLHRRHGHIRRNPGEPLMALSRKIISHALGKMPEATPPAPVCTYVLAATVPQVQALGFTTRADLDDTQQIASHTIIGGLSPFRSYGAITNTSAPQLWDFSTGKHAIRIKLTTPALAGGAGSVTVFGQVINAAQTKLVKVEVIAKSTGLFDVTIYDQAGSVFGVTGISTPPASAVILFDAAGTFKVWFLDAGGTATEKTLSRNTFTAGNTYLYMSGLTEAAGVAAGDAGKTYAVELQAVASAIGSYVGASVFDPCGNPIGG